MSLLPLLDELQRLGIRLRVEDGRLRFSAPRGAMTEALRARIASERSALIALLERPGQATAESEAPSDDRAPAPLSHAQQRLWVVEQLGGLGAAYSIPGAVEIEGALDASALRSALAVVMRRQPSLRTALRLVDGEPRQVVEAAPALPFEEEDLAGHPDPEAAAKERLAALGAEPLSLESAPLFRARLLRLGPERHVFVVVLHHAIADGWSISLLLRELGEAYGAILAGQAPDDTAVAPDYAELAKRERGPEGQAAIAARLDYWKTKLAGVPDRLELPADRPRPPVQSFRGASVRAQVPARTVERLRRLAQAEGASLFMALAAVFATLVARHSGEEDFLVGTPLAGRDRPAAQGLIGLFVNTLPLRCDLAGSPDFRTLLGRLRRTTLEAFDHAEVPFERLVEALQPERDPRYPPLCQVLFALQSALDERLELPGARLRPWRLETDSSKVDLFVAAETLDDGGLGLEAEYCSDLFEAARVERLLAHFVVLAEAAAEAPDRPVLALPMLTAAERRAQQARNPAPAEPSGAPTVPARFAERAAADPEAVALVFGERRQSYGALDAASARVASALLDAGVARGEAVGVHLPRGLALPAALLGILRAGAAYMPLETDLPAARRQALYADAGVRLVVTDGRHAADLADELAEGPVGEIPRVLDLDPILDASDAAPPDTERLDRCAPDELAYLLYTSGSTGRPKGVCVSHRNVIRLVDGIDWGARPPRTGLLYSSIAFDVSTLELWLPLLTGGRLVVAPPGPAEPGELKRLLAEERVELLWLTAGLFHRLAGSVTDALAGVRFLIAGGDVVSPVAAQAVLDRMAALGFHDHRLGNGYGPTETTTFATLHWMRPGERLGATVPIGRPIGNTAVQVVDRFGAPVPDGAPGELWIGGAGVARGYLGQPGLTAERFPADPFAAAAGASAGRLYRSGDRVRWRADETLEFLGRLDQQLKLRGFRVEPGEIEQALLQQDGIAEAAVVPHTAGSGSVQLVAYLVARDPTAPPAQDALRAAIAERLPAYMLPAHFLFIEVLPLNRSGKLDRRRLPAPAAEPGPVAVSRGPSGPVEARLAGLWEELLKREGIGAEENFFALGGDSILAMQLVLRAGQEGLAFGLRDLLEQQTIAGLARRIGEGEAATAVLPPETGPLPLTPIQRWFFARHLARPAHWNQAVLLETARPLPPERLQEGLDRLVARHEALRQRFPGNGRAGRAVVATAASVPLAVHAPVDTAEQERLSEALQAGLDLEAGPLFAAALFRRTYGSEQLLLVAHHLAVDVVSWGLLLGELGAFVAGTGREEPAVAVPWSAYASRLPEASLPEVAPADPLPLDGSGGANEEVSAEVVSLTLEAEATAAFLGPAHEALRSEPTQFLAAALAAALLDWSGGSALTLDLERHGRDLLPELDLSGTVGWLTRLDPRRIERPARETPEAWLKAVRRAPGVAAGGERAEVSLNYLGRLEAPGDGLLTPVDGPLGALYGAGAERLHLFELIAGVGEGRLRLELRYSPARHRRATAQALLEATGQHLSALLDWAAEPANGGLLPRDVPLAGLDERRLAALLERIGPRDGRHPARTLETLLPLSPQQLGMLFDSLSTPEGGLHQEQLLIRMEGTLDPERLRAAWRQASARHAILRTAFYWQGLPQPLQAVFRDAPPAWVERDGEPDADWLREDRLTPIALDPPGAFRLTLWRAGPEDWRLVWTFHHLLLDGWSMALLLREVMTLYAGEADAPALPAAPPYADYVAWLAERDRGPALAFWRATLSDVADQPPLAFGSDAVAGGDPFGERRVDLEPDEGARLDEAARRLSVTPGVLFQAAWALLLGGLLRRPEVVFGVTSAGRPEGVTGSGAIAGLFIDTLPQRVSLPAAGETAAWLGALFERHLGILGHPPVGAAEIARAAGLPPGRPLFESLLVYENYPSELDAVAPAGGGSGDLRVAEVAGCGARTRYPLTLLVVPGERIRLQLIFDRRRVPETLAGRLLALFRELLAGLAADRPLETLHETVAGAGLPAPAEQPRTGAATTAIEAPEIPLEGVLAEIWSELLGGAVVPPDVSFFELGGHSLLALEMIATVERRLGLSLDAATLFEAPTLRGLAAALAGLESSGSRPLMPLREGAGRPLVVLPGASGNPVAYLPLAERLAGRPVWGLQPAALGPAVSLEELACRLADSLAESLRAGPVDLLGHSFGAALAVATARQLERRGHPAGGVILLDLAAPGNREAGPAPSDGALLAEIARAAGRYFDRPLAIPETGFEGPSGREGFLACLAEAGLVSAQADAGLADRLLALYRDSLAMLRDWRPEPLAAPVTVVRARESEATGGAVDPTLGWARWTPVGHCAEVPGDHIGMIREPAVAELAALLRRLLASPAGPEAPGAAPRHPTPHPTEPTCV